MICKRNNNYYWDDTCNNFLRVFQKKRPCLNTVESLIEHLWWVFLASDQIPLWTPKIYDLVHDPKEKSASGFSNVQACPF